MKLKSKQNTEEDFYYNNKNSFIRNINNKIANKIMLYKNSIKESQNQSKSLFNFQSKMLLF